MRHFTSTSRLSGVVAALAFTAALGMIGQPLAAQSADHRVMPTVDVTFGAGPPHLPAGVGLVVMSGNPREAGLYILRLKFPAGYNIPPHTHPQAELVTVISGRLGIAMGETVDRYAAPLLEPGSFVEMPAKMAHYAWAEEETVVQLTGMGPFEINYLNEADDPRIN